MQAGEELGGRRDESPEPEHRAEAQFRGQRFQRRALLAIAREVKLEARGARSVELACPGEGAQQHGVLLAVVQATEAAEAKRPAARPLAGDRKLGVGDERRPDVDAVGGDAEPGFRELGDGFGIGDPARTEAPRASQDRQVGGLQVVAVLP